MVLYGSQLNKNSIHHFASGAAAGIIARTAVAPLEQIRTQQQLRKLTLRQSADFCKGKFFRGNIPNCAKAAPQSALQFGLYDCFKNQWQMSKLNSALAAGACAYTITFPMEVWKLKHQTSSGTMLADGRAVLRMCPKHFLCSFSASLISYSAFFCTHFCLFDFAKKYEPHVPLLLLSSASSAAASILWFPVDTWRKNLLLQREFVLARSYQGCLVNCLKTVPFLSLRFFLYEKFVGFCK